MSFIGKAGTNSCAGFLSFNTEVLHFNVYFGVSSTLQNSIAQLPVEELDRIQEYLQNSGLAQR